MHKLIAFYSYEMKDSSGFLFSMFYQSCEMAEWWKQNTFTLLQWDKMKICFWNGKGWRLSDEKSLYFSTCVDNKSNLFYDSTESGERQFFVSKILEALYPGHLWISNRQF